ncbi:MAG: NAD(P)-dependent dehydrogenase (short-subunit alcohol dehydrogenase family) [Bacteroidia bacterium]|jgi:NAD(P)-dependent dehydrogenase (short-subunit alcohol dehydrogenase family)
MDTNKIASYFDLTGKVILVTGGSRGLGYHMCRAFAQAGATLIISSRKAEACERAAQLITADTGAQCLPLACHVGDWEACDALVEAGYEQFGRIDVLVNNAGMSPLYESPAKVSRELFDKVIGVNLAGPYRLCATVGERMAAGEGGSIINVSSIASVAPSSSELPYAAAKAGLNNLTEGLARTFAPKVRCNCILPGPFLTDIADAWSEDVKQAVNAMVPLGRAGQPDEIVGTALYLASEASAYTNGAMIKVDGGAVFGS